VAETASASAREDIRLERKGSLALITLDRPAALNALTIAMRAALAAWFPSFSRDQNVYAVVIESAAPKAFSAGSDVREVVSIAKTDMDAARKTFRDEYALNWGLECFSKPTVSLIDGIVMGGGVGISLFGTHRVAGEGYRFAMPETKIGLFPDVGVCHAFARMPDGMGQYLGLTGRTIGRADAYALGLVTHCIAADQFGAIKDGLIDTMPIDPLLDERHADPGPGDHDELRPVIARCFSGNDVPEILRRLDAETGPHAQWAAATAAELRKRSPMSLAVTHRHIRDSASLDLRRVLEADYQLVCHFLQEADFFEGVRAVVIDKDHAPRWHPPTIEAVTAASVESYFEAIESEPWSLPTRTEMQARRA
jgi:enoyl-CoA hydratase